MANHPNRAPLNDYSIRLRKERVAGRKIIALIEAGASNDDLWDVAIASPREGDLLGLVLLSGFSHARKVVASNALQARGLLRSSTPST